MLRQPVNVEGVVAQQAAGVVQLAQRVVARRRLSRHRLAVDVGEEGLGLGALPVEEGVGEERFAWGEGRGAGGGGWGQGGWAMLRSYKATTRHRRETASATQRQQQSWRAKQQTSAAACRLPACTCAAPARTARHAC